jgi:hypothetical protein
MIKAESSGHRVGRLAEHSDEHRPLRQAVQGEHIKSFLNLGRLNIPLFE